MELTPEENELNDLLDPMNKKIELATKNIDIALETVRQIKNLVLEANALKENDQSTAFVIQLDNETIPLPGELLIQLWGNDICRVAWREQSHHSWGPPLNGEKRE